MYFTNTRSGFASAILNGLMSTCALDSVLVISAVLNVQSEIESLKDIVSAQKALQGSETDEKESQGAKDSFITLDQDLLKRVKFF